MLDSHGDASIRNIVHTDPMRTLSKYLFVVAVLVMVVYLSPPQNASVQTTNPPIDSTTWYSVVRVVDGDTIVASVQNTSVSVRLIGIDTPEVETPYTKAECFGMEASEKARRLLDGQNVRIETDSSQAIYDTYGRLLAYIYLHDGTLFNKYLITEGYGHEYTFDIPYKYQQEFKAAEKTARENKKGLWADGACA